MTEHLVKVFTVYQGAKKYEAHGYATACNLIHTLMKENPQPCRLEVVFMSLEDAHVS